MKEASVKKRSNVHILCVITVGNGLRPKYYIRKEVYVLILVSNGSTVPLYLVHIS